MYVGMVVCMRVCVFENMFATLFVFVCMNASTRTLDTIQCHNSQHHRVKAFRTAESEEQSPLSTTKLHN